MAAWRCGSDAETAAGGFSGDGEATKRFYAPKRTRKHQLIEPEPAPSEHELARGGGDKT